MSARSTSVLARRRDALCVAVCLALSPEDARRSEVRAESIDAELHDLAHLRLAEAENDAEEDGS